MSKEQEMKGVVTDAAAAAKILQLGDNVIMPPEGTDTSILEQSIVTQSDQQVAPEKIPVVDPNANQGQFSANQMQQMLNQGSQVQTETNDNVPEDEQQRRTFQSERDKAIAAQNVMQAQLEQMSNQNNMLMQTMAGMNANNQMQAPEVQAPQVDKEPDLGDFINVDDYDPSDATDPSTASGKAFSKLNQASARYNARSEFNQLQQKSQAEKAQQGFLKAAKQIAKENPEYRHFNGEPDLNKIQAYLNTFSEPENLVKLFGGGKTDETKETPATPNGLQKIGLRADQAQSIASTPAATTKVVDKNESEVVQRFKNIFG